MSLSLSPPQNVVARIAQKKLNSRRRENDCIGMGMVTKKTVIEVGQHVGFLKYQLKYLLQKVTEGLQQYKWRRTQVVLLCFKELFLGLEMKGVLSQS